MIITSMAFNITGIQYLFLVGGFAESPLLQMEIRKEFNSMLKVIIPQDVGLSILKGNVHIIQIPSHQKICCWPR